MASYLCSDLCRFSFIERRRHFHIDDACLLNILAGIYLFMSYRLIAHSIWVPHIIFAFMWFRRNTRHIYLPTRQAGGAISKFMAIEGSEADSGRYRRHVTLVYDNVGTLFLHSQFTITRRRLFGVIVTIYFLCHTIHICATIIHANCHATTPLKKAHQNDCSPFCTCHASQCPCQSITHTNANKHIVATTRKNSARICEKTSASLSATSRISSNCWDFWLYSTIDLRSGSQANGQLRDAAPLR